MKPENLSAIQLEHSLYLLGEVDLAPLLEGLNGSMVDMLKVLPMLKQVRDRKLLRRLAGIWRSTAQELEAAEADEQAWLGIESKGAEVPAIELLGDLRSFFGGLGLSLSDTPGFAASEMGNALRTGIHKGNLETPGASGS